MTATALAPASLTIAQPSLPEWSNEAVDTTSSTYLSLTIVNTGDQASGAITYQDTGDEFAIVAAQSVYGIASRRAGLHVPGQLHAPHGRRAGDRDAHGVECPRRKHAGHTRGDGAVGAHGERRERDDSATGGQCGTNFVSGATVASSDGESCSIVKGASSTCKELFSDGSSVTLSEALAPGSFASFSWVGCTGAAGVLGRPLHVHDDVQHDNHRDYCGHAS